MRATGGRANFGADRWIGDPRIPADVQVGEREFYGPAKQIDRGHIVRRQDNAWGADPREVEFANSDTFHWTNCTPQHAAFNRAAAPSRYQRSEGLWGAFETYVQRELMHGELRACILAGPVLAANDPVADFGAGPIAYAVDFWKVVIVAEKTSAKRSRLRAYGFMMGQRDLVEQFGIEFAPGRYARFRKPLAEISKVSGVIFDKALLRAEAAMS